MRHFIFSIFTFAIFSVTAAHSGPTPLSQKLSASLINTHAAAVSSTPGPVIAADANVGYALDGGWYNITPDASGYAPQHQGFEIQYYSHSADDQGIFVTWATYNPDGTEQAWFVAQGTLDLHNRTTEAMPIYLPADYGKFNAGTPPSSLIQYGTMTITISDCANAHVSWNFTQTLPNGIGQSGEMDIARLTPIYSLFGYDLCSTNLAQFDGDAGDADYQALLDQYNTLNSDYNSCVDSFDADETTIGNLQEEVNNLQDQVTSSYNDGYSDGYTAGDSDGYTAGYSDGSSAGYSDGYSVGYDAGYSDGYGDGVATCDNNPAAVKPIHNLLAAKRPVALASYLTKVQAVAISKAAAYSASHKATTPKTISPEMAKVQALVTKMKAELESLKKKNGPKKIGHSTAGAVKSTGKPAIKK